MPYKHIPVKHIYAHEDLAESLRVGNYVGMDNLSRIRKEQDISQADLAAMVGANQATISKIERGNLSVTLALIYKIAEALNVPPVALFGIPEAQLRVITMLNQMSPERQAAALTVLDAMSDN